MILTAREIINEYESGRIIIEPFKPTSIQANSVDLTLSPNVIHIPKVDKAGQEIVLDVVKSITHHRVMQINSSGTILKAGELYLGTHNEYVKAPDFVMVLHGISTLARYGLSIHQAAGFGDLGFEGYWTFEMVPVIDIRVYPGIRVAQVAFHRVELSQDPNEPDLRYVGKYVSAVSEPKLPVSNNV